MLTVKNLNVSYGHFKAVQNFKVEVAFGDRILIQGHHGSGKSSVLKAIIGHIRSKGEVAINGKILRNRSPSKMIKLGVSLIPENKCIFPNLSILEHIELARALSLNYKSVDEVLDLFPELNNFVHKKAYVLSGGQVKMLSLMIGLVSQPKILILDEPFSGISDIPKARLMSALLDLKSKKIGLVITGEDNTVNASMFDSILNIQNGVIKTSIS